MDDVKTEKVDVLSKGRLQKMGLVLSTVDNKLALLVIGVLSFHYGKHSRTSVDELEMLARKYSVKK